MPIVIDFEKDPFYRKGLLMGKKQGIKQGMGQGLQLEAKKILKEMLVERFGGLSEELVSKIDALEDLKEIERLIKLVLRLQSLEEFEQALG